MLTAIANNISEVTQLNANLAIDWNEVILLVIGAAIGLISSLATTVIQKHLDQKGKWHLLKLSFGIMTKTTRHIIFTPKTFS